MKFDIEGRLPGLNEMIEAAKQGKGKYQPYARMKDRYTSEIGWLAKKADYPSALSSNSRRSFSNMSETEQPSSIANFLTCLSNSSSIVVVNFTFAINLPPFIP